MGRGGRVRDQLLDCDLADLGVAMMKEFDEIFEFRGHGIWVVGSGSSTMGRKGVAARAGRSSLISMREYSRVGHGLFRSRLIMEPLIVYVRSPVPVLVVDKLKSHMKIVEQSPYCVIHA